MSRLKCIMLHVCIISNLTYFKLKCFFMSYLNKNGVIFVLKVVHGFNLKNGLLLVSLTILQNSHNAVSPIVHLMDIYWRE